MPQCREFSANANPQEGADAAVGNSEMQQTLARMNSSCVFTVHSGGGRRSITLAKVAGSLRFSIGA
jgi:hypothetical protein